MYQNSTKLMAIVLFLVLAFSQTYSQSNLPFSDNFESGSLSTMNWTITGNAEVSNDTPYDGSYCVKGPGQYNIGKSFSNLNYDIITVEYVMRASQTSKNSCQFGGLDENNKESAVVFFRHTGYIEAKDGPSGSSSIAIMPYSANTWYKIKIVLDFQNKTYDLYINDELKADNYGFFDTDYSLPNTFSWRSGETSGTGWIDNVSIYAATTDIKDNMNNKLTGYHLYANYPNPFNPSTTISFSLSKGSVVTLKIYDILGKEVKTLLREYKSAGSYDVFFDAKKLSSGTYIYKLDAGVNYTSTRKMILIK